MSDVLQRAITASVSVESGADTLSAGFQTSRRLWNQIWWCTFGYNAKLRRQRGDSWETFKRLRPKGKDGYPGKFGVQKAMADYWAYRDLADRCSSYTIADFDIAMRSWWSNLKSNPDARPPRPTKEGRTLAFEVGRNAKSLGDWKYRLTVLGGHIPDRHVIVRVHVRPGVKMADIHMLRITPAIKRRRYQVSLLTKKMAMDAPGIDLAAIDLGLINLGALAFEDGQAILYSGRHLLDAQRHGDRRAKLCKPSGYTGTEARLPASKRNKAYKFKGSSTTALGVHVFTTDVIRECVAHGVGTLAVGALTGIRQNKDFGATVNQKFHRWTQGRVREQLKWKGQEYGIEVVEISEAYTSQACSSCGVIRKANRVERGLYHCADCGAEVNADVNGALNMLARIKGIAGAKSEGVGGDLSTPPSLPPERKQEQEPAKCMAETHNLRTKRFDLRSMELVVIGYGTAQRTTATNDNGKVCELHP